MTGYGSEQIDQQRLEELGIAGCIYKPVKKADLEAAVQHALTERSARCSI